MLPWKPQGLNCDGGHAIKSEWYFIFIFLYTVTGLTIYSLGLTGHIKTHFPVMFRLYQVLQTHKEQPTEDEIAIASGKKLLDSSEASNYLLKLEKASANVLQMFSQQQQQAAVKFPNFVSCPVVSYAH